MHLSSQGQKFIKTTQFPVSKIPTSKIHTCRMTRPITCRSLSYHLWKPAAIKYSSFLDSVCMLCSERGHKKVLTYSCPKLNPYASVIIPRSKSAYGNCVRTVSSLKLLKEKWGYNGRWQAISRLLLTQSQE